MTIWKVALVFMTLEELLKVIEKRAGLEEVHMLLESEDLVRSPHHWPAPLPFPRPNILNTYPRLHRCSVLP